MGARLPKPSNMLMVDELVSRDSSISSEQVEGAFRAVDRAMYFDLAFDEDFDPYSDSPWRRGNLHISAPCIYAKVVEALDLRPGLSFLNLGSGTGYLNTIVGLLIGPHGLNHGVEVHKDVVEFARRRLKQFKAISYAIDKYDFSDPTFVIGNCLDLNPDLKYDRIYLGAACITEQENFIKNLIKPDGGILVMPFRDRLLRYVRISDNEWKVDELMTVNFTLMIVGPNHNQEENWDAEDEPNTNKQFIDMPLIHAKSLKDLCRVVVRQRLRDTINATKPELMNSSNLAWRQYQRAMAKRKMLENRERKMKRKLDDLIRQSAVGSSNLETAVNRSMETMNIRAGATDYLDASMPRRPAGSCGSSEASSSGLAQLGRNSKEVTASSSRVMTRSASAAIRSNQHHPGCSSTDLEGAEGRNQRAGKQTQCAVNSSSILFNTHRSSGCDQGRDLVPKHNRNNYCPNKGQPSEPHDEPDDANTESEPDNRNEEPAINLSAQASQQRAQKRPIVRQQPETRRWSQRLLSLRSADSSGQTSSDTNQAEAMDSMQTAPPAPPAPPAHTTTAPDTNTAQTNSGWLSPSSPSSSSLSFSSVYDNDELGYVHSSSSSSDDEPDEFRLADSSDSDQDHHYFNRPYHRTARSLFRFHFTSLSSHLYSRPRRLVAPPEPLSSSSSLSDSFSCSSSSSSISSTSHLAFILGDETEHEFEDQSADSSNTPTVQNIDSLFDSNIFESDRDSSEQLETPTSPTLNPPSESTQDKQLAQGARVHSRLLRSQVSRGKERTNQQGSGSSTSGTQARPTLSGRGQVHCENGRRCSRLRPTSNSATQPGDRSTSSPQGGAQAQGVQDGADSSYRRMHHYHHQNRNRAAVHLPHRAQGRPLDLRLSNGRIVFMRGSIWASTADESLPYRLAPYRPLDLVGSSSGAARRRNLEPAASASCPNMFEGKRKRHTTSSSSSSSDETSEPSRPALSYKRRSRRQAHRCRLELASMEGQLCRACSSETNPTGRRREAQTNTDRWQSCRPLDTAQGAHLLANQVASAEGRLKRARGCAKALMERHEGQFGRKRLRSSREDRRSSSCRLGAGASSPLSTLTDQSRAKSRRRRLKRRASRRFTRNELRSYYKYMRAAIRKLPLPRVLLSYLNYDES